MRHYVKSKFKYGRKYAIRLKRSSLCSLNLDFLFSRQIGGLCPVFVFIVLSCFLHGYTCDIIRTCSRKATQFLSQTEREKIYAESKTPSCAKSLSTGTVGSRVQNCQMKDIFSGCWREKAHFKISQVQKHISGNLEFLQEESLKLVWIPYACKYERFSEKKIFDLKDKCFGSKNITISILGDSTVRSIYCGIYRAMAVGENSFLPEKKGNVVGCGAKKAKRGVHSFDIKGITVEYHSTAVIGDMSKVKPIFPITKDKFSEGNQPLLEAVEKVARRKSDLILIHSAGWEFREIGLANIRKIVLKKDMVQKIYSRNIELMKEGIKSVSEILKQEDYNGIVLWRNAMCNTRYDSEEFEKSKFDDFVKALGIEVFDSFELSRGRTDAMHDGYHFDRPNEGKERKRRPQNYYRHEELNSLFTNILLNRLFENC